MANAAKRMKEKKAKQLEEILKAKSGVVEYVVDDAPVAGVVTDVTVDEDGDYTEEDLKDMFKSDLIELAESLYLDTDGTKAELVERILDA